ncbi:TRAP transporter permease [Testudinibacter aquarius]|uniref:TRAP transporter 4TM/12TM fusion protein n=1 Tax=Testudinibacter aquarius TaxID=1524974 RepID=A0A4R3Y225_9PAST|nr:TRAP transporter permease [Testudinibacter aquarius]TNG94136.1 TRAP transporter fused permease subunit [Pasteurellaceae bacterium UScroc12]TNG97539.1 TRAP transporter fused permease subunit [Pasteurellaceae bacterium USgator41]TNG99347.1 TRAP transporter fused permease subunit [Pasteurellaceae bacterium USgator11]TNG99591.1 TRAP transporter fused permease subunit [Pasteurellaceae bacterium UScroc31]KAE9527120.1 C4-dicarboxylate ABC transporter [Testudinibacter aquarius]
MLDKTNKTFDQDDLQDMVAANDSGGRNPYGFTKKLIFAVAILWSLFQIYYASPLPFVFQEMLRSVGLGSINVVFDDTKARSIHLAFALFLAYLSYPAFKSSPIHHVPILDWIFAFAATFCASYYLFFYGELVTRFGSPNTQDIIVGIVGILLLLEACRRSLGLPLVIIASVFLLYNYFGQYFPSSWIVSHRTGSLSHIINQQWITTEGVFGVALGVSTKYVFLFVLFGALLDKAGAGNYFIKTAFAFLGHFRGGPAKAAVVASGLTGLISGSSIANVVTTGTFTIPMMKRVGFSAEKAGAVEVASSVNGQIMPPVMGAAAFLMIEYVNMPYSQLITHAFLPAIISYIALVYIVHLEACKMDLKGLERADAAKPWVISVLRGLGSFITICVVYFIIEYGLSWIKTLSPDHALAIVSTLVGLVYLLLLKRVAKFDDLEIDDPNSPVVKLPSVKPTVNAGLHFLLPVVILIWCLMVERMSPGLSAFWGSLALCFILLTQRPILQLYRRQGEIAAATKQGLNDLITGLESGARNMIGIGIATATAGIIVGVVALTGFGVQLSSIIEFLSMGNILLMLVLVAMFSLILGMGLPTTANYIVVSSLMATVIVEVGRQNGLIVPLVAVHLFVFYFGIMADVTPPVGLASFAAAAVSGGNPIKTGLVAFGYSLRTAILPFLFIFNTDLLLIDVGFTKGMMVFIIATIAILAFTAASMRYFFDHTKWWETVLLLLITFMLFRPGFFMNYISPTERHIEPINIAQEIAHAPVGESMTLKVAGINQYGTPIEFFAKLNVPQGNSGEERIQNLGLTLLDTGEQIEVDGEMTHKIIIDEAQMDSAAEKAGLSWDQTILYVALPRHNTLAKEWMFIPALLLLFGLGFNQIRRRRKIES